MTAYGWLSILPPVIAIGLAIKTKQVYLSLALYVLLGWIIMSGWDPVEGLVRSPSIRTWRPLPTPTTRGCSCSACSSAR